ncbi:MAG: hypothetical protein PHE58_03480 [Candidatus Omnitrophica bacterium]|nr:hypothetical protein [Candidatus Omnitrophota bacterium]
MKNKQRNRLSPNRMFEYCEVAILEDGSLHILTIAPSFSSVLLDEFIPEPEEGGENKIYCG